MDALSAFFLLVVNLGAAVASLFALGYCQHEDAPHRVLPFYPAFLAGMNLMVLADDAFTFLASWEFMSISSWLLVMAHHRPRDNTQAAYVVLPLRQVAAPPQGTQQLLQTAHAIPNRRIKRDLTVEQKVAVSEVVQERARGGPRTLTIRLYDKLAAMAHLAKLLNLLVDRQEKSGPVEVTDHRARIMDRLNAIATDSRQ